MNRLTELSTSDGLNNLQGFSYTLDPTGRRTQITENTGRVTDYTYDDLYRLVEESITDAVNGNYSAQYQYDRVGNRTQSIIDGVTTAYTYDANDRITQYGGTTYTYDANGNTLTETLDGVIKTYTYNSQNELVSVDDSLDSSTYHYNVDGIRNGKTEAGIATAYLVDHNRDYAQVLAESESGTTVVQYTYGDDLISQQRGTATSYYHYDGLGSTRGLSDDTGSLSDTYAYEAFGELLNQTGSTQNHYLFTGEQFDNTLNQYYLRARYYNQANGRFTQMDTYQGRMPEPVTLHKYMYVHADPANMIDPSGNVAGYGLGQALNILAVAGNVSYTVFQVSTDPKGVSKKRLGTAIILSMLPAKSAVRLIKLSNARKKVNGNSKKSNRLQHVYKIDDTAQFDIYKYGISGAKLNKNGTSRRANTQANRLNRLIGFKRYEPEVLYRNIPGRVAALAIEYHLVCNVYAKNNGGRRPPGNKRPVCKP